MALGTSQSELINIILSLGLPNFKGVYDKNFPGFINPDRPQYAIVNTGDRSSGGVHWIAFAFDPNSLKFFLFDPFGFSKTELLKRYHFQYTQMMKNTALSGPTRCVELVRSTQAVQCPCSAACGLFCCLFLASFEMYRNSPMSCNPIIDVVEGVNHKKLLTPEGISITHTNQIRLYDWLYIHSKYFRNHVREIKENTKLYALKVH
nr:adenovirus endopeptidase [Siadenovirus sp.]